MTDAAIKAAKAQMRQTARRHRAELFETDRAEKSRAIAEHALTLLDDPARIVAAYWALRDEVDCQPLLLRLAERQQSICLPALVDQEGPLRLRVWDPDTPLYPSGFGTLAPADDAPEAIPDIMFLPLLAFDGRGTRLGYGGGHYDRTIASLPRRPRLVGLAFAAQELAEIPREPHDIPLDAVVTEDGVMRVGEEPA
jgi:5-formyltetrahydrofolate cyclo-ligase